MATCVVQAMAAGLNTRAQAYLGGDHVVALEDAPVPCLILGAGPTGLSAAYHYGSNSVVVEREAKPGGSCRSIEDTGFTFDFAGHVMLSDDPYVQDLYRLLLGDNVHWQEYNAWIYSDGTYTRCPSQGAPPHAQSPTRVAARFGYPLRGGFQALMNGFLPLLRGELVLGASVERVSPPARSVTLADGRHYRYDALVSTLPLPKLIEAIGDETPADIRASAGELRHASMRCVNLGVARPHVTDKHAIQFEGDTVFHRVFVQGNASPHCNPPGGFGLTCEVAYSATRPLPATGAALIERCVRDCVRVGLLDASDALLTSNELDVPYACILDDPGRGERVARIRDWLANFDIVLAGRYSEWQACDWDHAFVAGRKAAGLAQRLTSAHPAAKTG
jgi:protoporphyrinogen oxidase